MQPVSCTAAPKQVIGLNDITPISAPAELDYGDAWDAAKELFDLAAKASGTNAIVKAEEQLTWLLRQPSTPNAIEKAQKKLSQLVDEVDEIGQAQRTARDRVLELLYAKCTISGDGNQMIVSCDDPQQAPVRGLLLLVAISACSEGTRDQALSLVKAMASNHQFDNHPGWLSDEARAAVRVLSQQRVQQEVDLEILRNKWELNAAHGDVQQCAKLQHLERQEMESIKKIAETASTIAVLIRRAKLVSRTEKDTPEMQSFSQDLADEVMFASGCMNISWKRALGHVMALAGKNDQASRDEASNLLDWLAGLTHFPGEIGTGDVIDIAFTDTAAEQFVKTFAGYFLPHASSKRPEWLVSAVYQRDTAAYAKVALAYMQKIVAAPEVAAAEATVKAAEAAKAAAMASPEMWAAARDAYAKTQDAAMEALHAALSAKRAQPLTRDLIKICESDPFFLELVAKSDQVVLLYTKLTGKSPTPS